MTENKQPSAGYAVVEAGGCQHLVQPEDILRVNLLGAKEGERVELSPVLAISDGKKLTVGTPSVPGAKVTCLVMKDVLGPKVVSFKKKRRKGYRRKIGHRQKLTMLKVEKI